MARAIYAFLSLVPFALLARLVLIAVLADRATRSLRR